MVVDIDRIKSKFIKLDNIIKNNYIISKIKDMEL